MNELEYRKYVRVFKSYYTLFSNEVLYKAIQSLNDLIANEYAYYNDYFKDMTIAHRDAIILLLDERYDNIN